MSYAFNYSYDGVAYPASVIEDVKEFSFHYDGVAVMDAEASVPTTTVPAAEEMPMLSRHSLTKKMSGTGTVVDGPCAVGSYVVKGGTTATSMILKDDTTEMWADSIKAQTVAGDDAMRHTFHNPIAFQTNCKLTLGGTGAVAYLEYYSLKRI